MNPPAGDDIVGQFRTSLETVSEITRQTDDEIILDFSEVEWLGPAFLTPLSVVCNSISESGEAEISITAPEDPGVAAYLDQIGFPEGSEETGGYPNHLPIHRIDSSESVDSVEITGKKIRELLKRHLPTDVPTEIVTGVQIPITETVDNVDQHSNCDQGSILLQYYPEKLSLDICVSDNGIGIPGSYSEYGIDYDTHYEALEMAVEQGVSTKEDLPGNRGFGLKNVTEMVCSGMNGEVLVSSGEGILFKSSRQGATQIDAPYPFNGTTFIGRLEPTDEFDWVDYVY